MTDVLSNMLDRFRLRAELYHHQDYCGLWAVNTAGTNHATYHLVDRGRCWLHFENREPTLLSAGDLVVFPRDAQHIVSDSPEQPDPALINEPCDPAAIGPETTMTCGFFSFTHRRANSLLDALPNIILLRSDEAANLGWTEALVRFVTAELEADKTGRELVVNRLTEVLFVHLIRSCIDRGDHKKGLLAALADPRISKAMAAIHNQPGSAWTLNSLAKETNLSRSSFSSNFNKLLGITPLKYLTELRMDLALEQLENGLSVTEVAERAGYSNEVAFRKAFSKHFGRGPGSVRKQIFG